MCELSAYFDLKVRVLQIPEPFTSKATIALPGQCPASRKVSETPSTLETRQRMKRSWFGSPKYHNQSIDSKKEMA